MKSAASLIAGVATVALGIATAAAQPIRLRGDALATVQAPAGLLVLQADDRSRSWIDAEAVVWFGGTEDEADGNALIMAVDLRAPRDRAELRIGRQIMIAGALRPVHFDGATSWLHLPRKVDVQVFGGLPVVPGLGPHAYDWLTGTRVSRPLGAVKVGLAWMQRRDHGALHTHELAADGSWSRGRVDVAAGAAWDLISSGLAELNVSTAWRRRRTRHELFVAHRSPSHLMPATSLFSVLGDVPARRIGGSSRWRAAPRLDLRASAALRLAGDDLDGELAADARLRLDDRGVSSLGIELRRQGSPDGGWTGFRGTGRLALAERWSTAAELELAVPDDADGRGTVWPWALVAVTWVPAAAWELAAAVEASSTPTYRSRFDGLLRLSRQWDGP